MKNELENAEQDHPYLLPNPDREKTRKPKPKKQLRKESEENHPLLLPIRDLPRKRAKNVKVSSVE